MNEMSEPSEPANITKLPSEEPVTGALLSSQAAEGHPEWTASERIGRMQFLNKVVFVGQAKGEEGEPGFRRAQQEQRAVARRVWLDDNRGGEGRVTGVPITEVEDFFNRGISDFKDKAREAASVGLDPARSSEASLINEFFGTQAARDLGIDVPEPEPETKEEEEKAETVAPTPSGVSPRRAKKEAALLDALKVGPIENLTGSVFDPQVAEVLQLGTAVATATVLRKVSDVYDIDKSPKYKDLSRDFKADNKEINSQLKRGIIDKTERSVRRRELVNTFKEEVDDLISGEDLLRKDQGKQGKRTFRREALLATFSGPKGPNAQRLLDSLNKPSTMSIAAIDRMNVLVQRLTETGELVRAEPTKLPPTEFPSSEFPPSVDPALGFFPDPTPEAPEPAAPEDVPAPETGPLGRPEITEEALAGVRLRKRDENEFTQRGGAQDKLIENTRTKGVSKSAIAAIMSDPKKQKELMARYAQQSGDTTTFDPNVPLERQLVRLARVGDLEFDQPILTTLTAEIQKMNIDVIRENLGGISQKGGEKVFQGLVNQSENPEFIRNLGDQVTLTRQQHQTLDRLADAYTDIIVPLMGQGMDAPSLEKLIEEFSTDPGPALEQSVARTGNSVENIREFFGDWRDFLLGLSPESQDQIESAVHHDATDTISNIHKKMRDSHPSGGVRGQINEAIAELNKKMERGEITANEALHFMEQLHGANHNAGRAVVFSDERVGAPRFLDEVFKVLRSPEELQTMKRLQEKADRGEEMTSEENEQLRNIGDTRASLQAMSNQFAGEGPRAALLLGDIENKLGEEFKTSEELDREISRIAPPAVLGLEATDGETDEELRDRAQRAKRMMSKLKSITSKQLEFRSKKEESMKPATRSDKLQATPFGSLWSYVGGEVSVQKRRIEHPDGVLEFHPVTESDVKQAKSSMQGPGQLLLMDNGLGKTMPVSQEDMVPRKSYLWVPTKKGGSLFQQMPHPRPKMPRVALGADTVLHLSNVHKEGGSLAGLLHNLTRPSKRLSNMKHHKFTVMPGAGGGFAPLMDHATWKENDDVAQFSHLKGMRDKNLNQHRRVRMYVHRVHQYQPHPHVRSNKVGGSFWSHLKKGFSHLATKFKKGKFTARNPLAAAFQTTLLPVLRPTVAFGADLTSTVKQTAKDVKAGAKDFSKFTKHPSYHNLGKAFEGAGEIAGGVGRGAIKAAGDTVHWVNDTPILSQANSIAGMFVPGLGMAEAGIGVADSVVRGNFKDAAFQGVGIAAGQGVGKAVGAASNKVKEAISLAAPEF